MGNLEDKFGSKLVPGRRKNPPSTGCEACGCWDARVLIFKPCTAARICIECERACTKATEAHYRAWRHAADVLDILRFSLSGGQGTEGRALDALVEAERLGDVLQGLVEAWLAAHKPEPEVDL